MIMDHGPVIYTLGDIPKKKASGFSMADCYFTGG